VVLVVALLVPLGLASLRTSRYEGWVYAPTDAAEIWVQDSGWKLDSVRVAGDQIVITVLGPGEPPPLEELRQAVRRQVPDRVPVELVEESGVTTQL
jgi:hypothetical protein